MQTEWMDEKEFAVFEKELNSDPSRGPVNRGVNDLMGVMMGTRR